MGHATLEQLSSLPSAWERQVNGAHGNIDWFKWRKVKESNPLRLRRGSFQDCASPLTYFPKHGNATHIYAGGRGYFLIPLTGRPKPSVCSYVPPLDYF